MKVCTKCKIELPFEEFNKDRSKKDGLYSSCKSCQKALKKNYYLKNKEKVIELNNKWRKNNPEKVKTINQKYRDGEKYNKWKDENKEYLKVIKKEWRFKNKNKVIECKKRWNSSEKGKIYCRNYSRSYKENRRKNDLIFKLQNNISCLIRNSIKNRGFRKNNSKTSKIIGCSIEEFKLYIELQFKEGMCWENYGEWEFDHIKPISLAVSEQEVLELSHYTNFQPLWKIENILKGNTYFID